jgi:hypothetical protein
VDVEPHGPRNTVPNHKPTYADRFIDKTNNNMVERLHGTNKEGTKRMRGLDEFESATKMVDGVRLAYNFMRPHSSLNGRTPAEAAGLPALGDGNRWKTMIQNSVEAKERKETSAQTWRRRTIEGTIKRYLEGEGNGVNAKWVLNQIESLKRQGMTEAELREILSRFDNTTLMAFLR